MGVMRESMLAFTFLHLYASLIPFLLHPYIPCQPRNQGGRCKMRESNLTSYFPFFFPTFTFLHLYTPLIPPLILHPYIPFQPRDQGVVVRWGAMPESALDGATSHTPSPPSALCPILGLHFLSLFLHFPIPGSHQFSPAFPPHSWLIFPVPFLWSVVGALIIA